MSAKVIQPSIAAVSFNCPHCGALADQVWFDAYAYELDDHGTPFRLSQDQIDDMEADKTLPADIRRSLVEHSERVLRGEVMLDGQKDLYQVPHLANVAASKCFSCKQISVWIGDRVAHPAVKTGVEPNPDLPDDILHDYNEARRVLDLSPRSAAALLRLCIQKLCKFLGEPGENLNTDIANLVVRRGLSERVKKALDTVRVVGNDSVHPGQLDIRDNREVAGSLFRLVNIIAEKTISEDKHIDEAYQALVSPSKQAAIKERDEKAKKTSA